MPVSGPRSRSRSSGDGEAPPRRLRRMSRPSAAAPPANVRSRRRRRRRATTPCTPRRPPAAGRRVERQPPVAVEPDLDPRVRSSRRPAALVLVEVSAGEARRDAGRDPEIPQHQRHRAREVLAVAATSWSRRRRAAASFAPGGDSSPGKSPLERNHASRDRRGIGVPRSPDHLASLAVERLVLRLFVVLVEQLLQLRVTPRLPNGGTPKKPRRSGTGCRTGSLPDSPAVSARAEQASVVRRSSRPSTAGLAPGGRRRRFRIRTPRLALLL